MSQEYAMDGTYSVKSDAYSFGVLVLEIICGQKNKGVYAKPLYINLLARVEEELHSSYALNLNLPPENNTQDTDSTFGIDINAEPLDDSFTEVNNTEAATSILVQFVPEPSNISVKKAPIQIVEQQSAQSAPAFPKLVGSVSDRELSKDASLGSETVKDNAETVKYALVDPTLVADALANAVDDYRWVHEYDPRQFSLMKFPEMGFSQTRISVEDYCPFVEWDPLRYVLESMGIKRTEITSHRSITYQLDLDRSCVSDICYE